MSQRKSQPVKWSPRGLSDTLDTSEIFDGAMALLQNLVPDPSTANVWQCRPAAQLLNDFHQVPGISTFGAITPGAGYTNGVYNGVTLVNNTRGMILSATANITVAGGIVTVVTPVFGGRGAQVGDVMTAPASSIGGTGAGFTVPVATVGTTINQFDGISALLVVGNLAFGMVGSVAGIYNGFDIPFCFNLLTKQFVTISGITTANVPTSLPSWTPPATPPAWIPPTMALIASKVMVTHAGFPGTGTNFVGQIDISTPTAPAWSTHQLTGAVTFTVVPTWVENFNGRAYYINNDPIQPGVIFSDVLAPTNCTNGNQVLTFNDNQNLTAMGPLQLNNQLGGIVQSLMVFKGVSNIYQVVGDAALNNLTVNTLNVATGTLAPNSISATPKGLAFMAPDGYRIIDFQASVSNPIGQNGSGTTVPFINAVVPSRVSSSCNGTIFRTTVQNGIKPGTPVEEYWYQFEAHWSGPHLFPITSAQFTAPALSAAYNNTFICAYAGMPGSLWRSDYYQSATSTFVENGTQMTWVYQTPELPSAEQMGNIAITETTLMCAFGVGTTAYGVSALSPSGAGIAATQLTSQVSATVWGSFTWGGAVWGSQLVTLADHQVAWPIPIVSTRISFQVNGNCAQNVKLGTLRARYQPLSQFLTPAAGVL